MLCNVSLTIFNNKIGTLISGLMGFDFHTTENQSLFSGACEQKHYAGKKEKTFE